MSMCEDCYASASQEELRERVNAGVNWLNEHAPSNWRELIDPDTLDVDDPYNCILGQVFADKANNPDFMYNRFGLGRMYHSGYDYAVLEFFNGSFSDNETGPFGFSAWTRDRDAIGVTRMWLEVLSA